MAKTEGQDALSAQRPASSLITGINYDLIAKGSDQLARAEIASALKKIVDGINSYISRKGV